jgi:hypothetical protein
VARAAPGRTDASQCAFSIQSAPRDAFGGRDLIQPTPACKGRPKPDGWRSRRTSVVLAATQALGMFVALTEAASWDNGTGAGVLFCSRGEAGAGRRRGHSRTLANAMAASRCDRRALV